MTATRHFDVIDLADGTARLHADIDLDGPLTLDELGEAHRQLLYALEELRPALRRRLVEERNKGVTWQKLQARSGYASITSVRLAALPELRKHERELERDRRRAQAAAV